MDETIAFPNLGIVWKQVGKSITVFGFEIAYYGMILAMAMVAGLLLAMYLAKKTNQDPDIYFDLGIWGIIAALIGARAYYVCFSWDYYKEHLLEILNVRGGGLAIFGGVIGGLVALLLYAKKKKKNPLQLADTACLGLILGQVIGRWGNFFNREAFGGYTNNLFAMQIPINAVRSNEITEQMKAHLISVGGTDFIQVHPTFLYESVWNLILLGILLWLTKHKRFHGQIFYTYLLGYGLGRAWIEGLRTDQLLILHTNLPVSQVLSVVLVITAALLLLRGFYQQRRRLGGSANGK